MARRSFIRPALIVLERSSRTAKMRALPTLSRRPETVVAMAVGWCAKSSQTATPAGLPRSSMRRRTPLKRAKDSTARTGSTPAACAAPTAARKDAVNRRVGAVDYQFTGPGYRSDEVVKLGLDRCKIGEDICMIELNVVQNGNPRPVMHHLGTLIEEGSIVFVGFDHEMALFSQLRRDPKIERHTPDEKAGGQSRIY